MIVLPVFQMILQPHDEGTFGLAFSEEIDDFVQPIFVIPLAFREKYWWENKYYMPGEINGNYTDFMLTLEPDIFLLSTNLEKQTIRFQIGESLNFRDYEIYDKRPRSPFRGLQYSGKNKNFIQPFTDFLMISPIDLLIMDTLFYQYKACFVGLTPTFGERRNYLG